jgi:hypothetical protein
MFFNFIMPVVNATGAGASTADAVSYDNGASGLAATDVQAAIDEVAAASAGDVTSFEDVANSTGNETISPAAGKRRHSVDAVITGTAGTRIFILDVADRAAGDEIEIDFTLPDTASIVLEVRNATSGGTLIYSHTTNGTEATDGFRLLTRMRFDGTAFEGVEAMYPVV